MACRPLVIALSLMMLGGCGSSSDDSPAATSASAEEALARCDSARAKVAAAVDPIFYEDPSFHYESMLKPLTEFTAALTYDTGVTAHSGITDGIEWICLISPQLDEAQWGWDE